MFLHDSALHDHEAEQYICVYQLEIVAHFVSEKGPVGSVVINMRRERLNLSELWDDSTTFAPDCVWFNFLFVRGLGLFLVMITQAETKWRIVTQNVLMCVFV